MWLMDGNILVFQNIRKISIWIVKKRAKIFHKIIEYAFITLYITLTYLQPQDYCFKKLLE